MTNNKERILILDGQTSQSLACVRSLGQAGYKVLVASHQRFPLGAWSRYCEGSYRLPDQTLNSFAAMRDWAKDKSVHIVLPLTERSCLLANAERGEWESAGTIVGCGPNEMLHPAFDKAQTLSRAQDDGIRIPFTRLPTSLEDCTAAVGEIGFPCVVKPRSSSGWDGSSFSSTSSPAYVYSSAGLSHFLAQRRGLDWPLIQEFVPGQGKGVFALCDQGRVVALFAHERLRETRPTGSASSLRRSVPLDPRLRDPAVRLLRELKWHGPAMVEFKDDGINPPCLMEINGRFWGSLQLAIDAGVDFPGLWVSLLKGNEVESVTEYKEGLVVRWLLGDIKRFAWILRGTPKGFPGTYPTIREGIQELLGPQPEGTRLETWRSSDPWPAVAELAAVIKAFPEFLKLMWSRIDISQRKRRQVDRAGNETPYLGEVL
ncbi:MAG: ATP-grasp domain-containing protein [Pyrinomonadaceae bacterium]